ncbi:hypothetical protein [Streptomyces avermitilis]|uniref:hypothetical protein n=1 Tax=Streptomyces avermitilis TaxID=33903 RepID=UPI00382F85B2
MVWGLGSFVAYAVAAWGVVVSLALIEAVAWGYCGPRNECGGRGALVLGPFGIVLGILLEGFMQRKRRYQGPSAFMLIFQSVLVGSAVVFACSVFLAESPVGWRVFMGVLTVLSAGGEVWLIVNMVRVGLSESIRRMFWMHDTERAGNGRVIGWIYPETTQERTRATILLALIAAGMGVGAVLGFVYVR